MTNKKRLRTIDEGIGVGYEPGYAEIAAKAEAEGKRAGRLETLRELPLAVAARERDPLGFLSDWIDAEIARVERGTQEAG